MNIYNESPLQKDYDVGMGQWHTRFFNKQHFHKQRKAEIGKKIKQMLSNTLRLNFYYLKIIHILHPCYHPKIIGHILKIKQKSKCVCFHEIIRLIIMKMEMKMKNGSHRHETNKIRSRDNECLIMMMFICIKQHLSNI